MESLINPVVYCQAILIWDNKVPLQFALFCILGCIHSNLYVTVHKLAYPMWPHSTQIAMSSFMEHTSAESWKKCRRVHWKQQRRHFWEHKICEEWLKDSLSKRTDWGEITYMYIFIHIYSHNTYLLCMYILYAFLYIHTHTHTKREMSHCPNSLKGKTGCNPLSSQHRKSGFEYHQIIRLWRKCWSSHHAPTLE